MATRAKDTAVVPGSSDLPDPDSLEIIDEDSPFDRLISAYSGLGVGEKAPSIKLYSEVQVDHSQPYHIQQQQQANLGKFQYLRSYTPEELDGNDLDMIRSQFGPGKYELRLYGYKPGSTRYTVIAKPQILIGALPGAAPVQQSVSPAAPQSDVTAVLTMIAKGQEQLLAALTQRPDPMANMKEMLTMATMFKEAFGSGNNHPQQKSSIAETLEAIKELRAMSELINPKEPEESPEEKMMKMAQPLIGLATAALQKPAQVVPQISAPPMFQDQSTRLPQKAEVAANPPVEGQSSDDEIKAKLEADLKKLLEMAEAKAPVEDGAEFLYENLPDEFVELLGMEMWWEGLSSHIPQVVPHEEWLRKVRDRLLAIFEEESEEAESAQVTASQAVTK